MADNNSQKDRLADVFVSVVAVLDGLPFDNTSFVREVQHLLDGKYTNYELLLVDNGVSADQLVELRAALTSVPCVRILRLSRGFEQDTAIFAGLDSAIGDVVVVFTPGFDRIELIPELVSRVRSGADIVQGISTVSLGGTVIGRLGRKLFYAYNRRSLGVEISPQATYLTGVSRRAVNSLTSTSRNHRYLRHLIQHVGFPIEGFSYEPDMASSRKRTVRAGAREAVEMVSSYSTHPLRIVTAIGVAAGLLNLMYAIYVLIVGAIYSDVAEGWTTTSLQLSAMFFIICIILAVQSEYVGRTLAESRQEPSYFVAEEIESETRLADLERRNVLS
ncbi:glycosyltransferase [Glaciihabitans tibetensis]|nr:glycosyltransferase [Glaciihabitans tibetensis]